MGLAASRSTQLATAQFSRLTEFSACGHVLCHRHLRMNSSCTHTLLLPPFRGLRLGRGGWEDSDKLGAVCSLATAPQAAHTLAASVLIGETEAHQRKNALPCGCAECHIVLHVLMLDLYVSMANKFCWRVQAHAQSSETIPARKKLLFSLLWTWQCCGFACASTVGMVCGWG
jgi:hypothetical protein